MKHRLKALLLSGVAAACIGPAHGQTAGGPGWLRVMSETTFDGQTDDLVTGGLGFAAMAQGPEPTYADPLHPTAQELRRASLAIGGDAGLGSIWGPTVDAATGEILPGDGKVAGTEYLAYADAGDGSQNVAFLLQVPERFDRSNACILAVPTGGSASLYRDIGTIGYWGLQKNCAVVYADKGLGNGFHDLGSDTVTLIDGTRAQADEAGRGWTRFPFHRRSGRKDAAEVPRRSALPDCV